MFKNKPHLLFPMHNRTWPVLVVMLVAALVPSACVLWFMNQAMENQQLAMRQRMTDVFEQQLKQTQGRINERWGEKIAALNQIDHHLPSSAFASLVQAGIAQSVIVYDDNGNPLYPNVNLEQTFDADLDQTLLQIQQLEFAGNVSAALEAAKKQSALSMATEIQARFLMIEARCLIKLNRKDEALDILTRTLTLPAYDNAYDNTGRHIPSDALLHALELIQPRDGADWLAASEQFAKRINNYDTLNMPSSQRRFLMAQMLQWVVTPMPTLEAETLASEYLQQGMPASRPFNLSLSPNGKFWTLARDDGHVVALFTPEEIQADFQACMPDQIMMVGARMIAFSHGQTRSTIDLLLSMPLGPMFPDWQLAVYDTHIDHLSVSIARKKAVLLWSAVAVIGLIAIMTLTITAYISRSIRLTQLKNDLIATVSHELKTPLASMRVLVDTLRDGRCRDEQQAREYFELIARENQRLTRLIDNFLTFSRMERNKRSFVFEKVAVTHIIDEAVAAVAERFESGDATLNMDIAADLRDTVILADGDAMVTVLLNLLDNAWKYTGQRKLISLKAYRSHEQVFIAVSDNGIGLSRRALGRVFDRFYQVDQTLSRQVGGCGLGLSIVKFIVDAHGGAISVTSQPGKGSTFTLQLKADSATAIFATGSNDGR